jgi:hypothetical protein
MAINKASKFLVGCDFAARKDYAALAIAEEIEEYDLEQFQNTVTRTPISKVLHLRYLKRLPLGTAYTEVADVLVRLMGELSKISRQPTLICDSSGVGDAVTSFLVKAGLAPIGIVFTSGQEVVKKSWARWHVPKSHLVSSMLLLMQDSRFRIAAGIPDVPLLIDELRSFVMKRRADSAAEIMEALSAAHDDLVSACLLVCFYHEKRRPKPAEAINLRALGGALAVPSMQR